MGGRTRRDRVARREMLAFGVGIVAVVVAVAVAGKGAETVENELWRWLWTALAIVMGIGEIFTAGFFLLPFAIGAAASAILAWVGAGVLAQWLVFFGVSIVARLPAPLHRPSGRGRPSPGRRQPLGRLGRNRPGGDRPRRRHGPGQGGQRGMAGDFAPRGNHPGRCAYRRARRTGCPAGSRTDRALTERKT